MFPSRSDFFPSLFSVASQVESRGGCRARDSRRDNWKPRLLYGVQARVIGAFDKPNVIHCAKPTRLFSCAAIKSNARLSRDFWNFDV